MSVLPRVRLELARRPWIYWLVVGVGALLAWLSVLGAKADAREAQTAWGSTRTVYVATRGLASGDPVRATARQYPVAMVPASAITELADGTRLSRAVAAGEVLVAADVATDAVVPPGWVVFAVATDVAPQLAIGDTVVVYGQGVRWADGVVGAIGDGVVEVAVPADDAEAVSTQVAMGEVVLAKAAPD